MHVALGLLAAALAGEPAPSPDVTIVSFQFRVLEMEGLDWRASVDCRPTPKAGQGTTSVWMTSRGMARSLTERADRVVCAPRLAMEPGATGIIEITQRRSSAGPLTCQADGSVKRASAVEFEPQCEPVRQGFQGKVCGLVEGQGVRTRLSLDDARVMPVHEVKPTEVVGDEEGGEAHERPLVQVPGVVSVQVQGEWLVPTDKVLVVSLGTHTVVGAGADDASVRERLVIVEPEVTRLTTGTAEGVPVSRALFVPMMSPVGIGPVPPLVIALPDSRSLLLLGRALEAPGLAHWPLSRSGVGFAPAPPPPSAVAQGRSMPTPPARSLPQAFDPDGTPAALPPLPDDELKPASDEESAEPRPSPQTRPIPGCPESDNTPARTGKEPVDRIDRASTEAAPVGDALGLRKPVDPKVVKADLGGRRAGDCCAASGSCPAAEERPASEPITIRIQFQGDRAIEIRGSWSWTSGTRRNGPGLEGSR
jgi:hypothetical protein